MTRLIAIALACLLSVACSEDKATEPAAASTAPAFPSVGSVPSAERRAHEITQHGETRIDHYHWLRDGQWQELLRDPSTLEPEIRSYLEAENAYFERSTAELDGLKETLVAEMRGRIKEDDSTVPAVDGPWAYARRYREGGEYPIFVRTPREGGDEQILFDGDLESQGAEFFNVASVKHSPDHSMIAYSVDRTGSEYFDIRVRNIETGEEFEETVSSAGSSVVWAADSRSFFYVERDDNQRPRWARRHVLGTPSEQDELLFEESDDSFFVSLAKSQSGEYLFIRPFGWSYGEALFLRTDAPPGTAPTMLAPRKEDELYEPVHHGEHFYLLTNADGAVDFKVMRTPIATPGRDHWEEWLPAREGVNVVDVLALENWLVRLERENALPRITVSSWDLETEYTIDFSEQAYSLALSSGYEFATDMLRFNYESPSTPEQTYDYNLKARERTLRKTRELPSGHNPELYVVERRFVEADDGARIPVTLLRLKTTPVDGTAPLYLYGYGSYGITEPAFFSRNILSLVDRGVVFAIGHVRGGAAMGQQWYLDGKLEHKARSFSDFARVAEELQRLGYGAPDRTVISGGSAGGLLVAATVNLRPDLFAGVVAAVPFVDALNTISDASLPLTPPEWAEWGNPIEDPEAYATILAYSPYENLRDDVPYPPIFATAGLTDYRVGYWEPVKWIARLRAETEGGPFFMKTDMGAGHAGSAARFKRLRESADYYAFALKVFGLESETPVSHAPEASAAE